MASTPTEIMQRIWREYERDHDHEPASAREVVQWAVDQGIMALPQTDPVEILSNQLSRALRQEYNTDSQGRRYRVNHAVPVMRDGVQHTIWGMLDFADYAHMEMAFTQRREQIIGDCYQLKMDVDVYNERHSDQEPIQLVIDFTDDVAEREVLVGLF